MNTLNTIRMWAACLMAVWLFSCSPSSKKAMNKRITLWRNDKIRYGSFIAHEWIKEAFPKATLKHVKTAPGSMESLFDGGLENFTTLAAENEKKIRVIISPKVLPDDREWARMLDEIGEGADYFISTFRISKSMADSLRIDIDDYEPFQEATEDSLITHIVDPVSWEQYTFSYPGADAGKALNNFDSSVTTILGTNEQGKPNFVRFHFIKGGNLYLHTSPLAFSNFFLLHKNNHGYFEKAMSWSVENKHIIEWDDYFRNKAEAAEPGFSRLNVILREPALRAAFWVVLLMFGLMYLLETKRKQSVIPLPPKIKNSSNDFVETVSALYFQRKDNKNLVEKMITQFGDHIYRKYFIRLALGDAAFIPLLAAKTGMGQAFLETLLANLEGARLSTRISDEQLLETNAIIQQFYKKEQHG